MLTAPLFSVLCTLREMQSVSSSSPTNLNKILNRFFSLMGEGLQIRQLRTRGPEITSPFLCRIGNL
jgi:hypothetical protein